MSSTTRKRFEVDEDIPFQRRDWTFERVGWGAMLLIVLAASLGAFGRGPLSDASATTTDGSLRVDYDRFVRHGAPAILGIAIPRAAAADTVARVWVDHSFMQGIQLDRIVPEPQTQAAAPGGTQYEFLVEPGTDTARVAFHYTPDELGSRQLHMGLAGHPALRRTIIVYP